MKTIRMLFLMALFVIPAGFLYSDDVVGVKMYQYPATVTKIAPYTGAQLKSFADKGVIGGAAITVKMEAGPLKDKTVVVEHYIYEDDPYVESTKIEWNPGDKVDVGMYLDSQKNIKESFILGLSVEEAADDEHKLDDELISLQEARGKMEQASGLIIEALHFTPEEVQVHAKVGAFDGFHYSVKMQDGKFKDTTIKISHLLFKDDILRPVYKVGDNIFVGYIVGNDGAPKDPAIYGINRSLPIILLLVLFIGGVIALGRLKGVLSLTALLITILLIFVLFIPSIISGASPLLMAVVVAILASAATFIIVSGFTFKSLSAGIGVAVGFIISALLVFIFGELMGITGIMNNDLKTLAYTNSTFNIRGILFSGILIGAIGAMMDVAISMSSTVEELRKANPNYTPLQLFVSSLNVGKDLLGTMVNTLILAYIGAALPFVLLIYIQYTSATPLLNILNLEIISEEILRSLVGSIGMLVTIPAASFFAAYLPHQPKKTVK
ncbi:MAG: YibE/F family protein [Brevinematales bacterium]|nr:YibE/F family protein [Brevinematales bacterium]